MTLERADGEALRPRRDRARSRPPSWRYARRRRERRLQRADCECRPAVARRGADPRYLPLLRQTGTPYSQHYMWTTLRTCRAAASSCSCSSTVSIRAVRATRSEARRGRSRRDRDGAEGVESLDEDRIIRHFLNVVQSTVRTNFFQPGPDGEPGPRSSSSSTRRSRSFRRRGRSAKSSSTRRGSRACICASARWRAAASAGRTGRTTSAPRCSVSSRRSR